MKPLYTLIIILLSVPAIKDNGQEPGQSPRQESDTLIKWSSDRRLNYSDFMGKPPAAIDPAHPDTLATVAIAIGYNFKIVSGRLYAYGFAVVYPRKSWIIVKDPDVLTHEQGHFDLTEVFARRLEKMANDTVIRDVHDYYYHLLEVLKKLTAEMQEEQAKYDAWTMNAPGKEYYFKWINEALAAP